MRLAIGFVLGYTMVAIYYTRAKDPDPNTLPKSTSVRGQLVKKDEGGKPVYSIKNPLAGDEEPQYYQIVLIPLLKDDVLENKLKKKVLLFGYVGHRGRLSYLYVYHVEEAVDD